jgi:hypothetical protein
MGEVVKPIVKALVLELRPIKLAFSEAQNKFARDCDEIASQYEKVFAEIKESDHATRKC